MRRSLLASGLIAAMLSIGVASANASDPIEGIWSFNGGKVGIQAQPDGKFLGTVVAPTKFSECLHPTGEEIWTGITPQADGSYWGYHQWYFASEACIPNPTLGLTAWRILHTSAGAKLSVCFSEPGSKSQPTIAPDGSTANATYGCASSALVAPLPIVKRAQFSQYVTLPGDKACFGRRRMRIRMRDPKNDPLKTIVVRLRSGKIQRRAKLKRHGSTVTATLNLRGLSADSFTVTVKLTTVLGDRLSGKRTYRLCATKHRRPHKRHQR